MKTLFLVLLLAVTTSAGVVTGRVSPSEGIDSMLRISVRITGEVNRVSRVNRFGYYRFQDIPEGEYLVEAVTARWLLFEPSAAVVDVGVNPVEVNFIFHRYNPCLVPCLR